MVCRVSVVCWLWLFDMVVCEMVWWCSVLFFVRVSCI